MDPIVTSSIVGGATSVGSSIINQAFAEHNRKRNYYWNEKAANSADERQRKQYYDLYSPQAQVQQLKDAGLSPSTMYGGQSASGQSMGNMSMGASGPQGPYLDPLAAAQIANIKAQTEKTKAETQEIHGETDPSKASMALLEAQTAEALSNAGYLKTSEEFKKSQTEWQNITNRFLSTEKQLNIEKMSLELENIIHNNELIKWQAKNEGLKYEFNLQTFDERAAQIEAELTKTLNEGMLALARTNESIKNLSVMDFNMSMTAEQVMQGWRKLEIEDAGQKAQAGFYRKMGNAALLNANTNFQRLEAEKGWKEKELDLTKRGQNLTFATNLIEAFVSKQNTMISVLGDIAGGLIGLPTNALGGAARSAKAVKGFK